MMQQGYSKKYSFNNELKQYVIKYTYYIYNMMNIFSAAKESAKMATKNKADSEDDDSVKGNNLFSSTLNI